MAGPMPPGPLGPGYGVSDGKQHMIANESGGGGNMPPTVIPKEDNKFKVVISAAPVINKPKTEKKKKKEKKAKLSEPQDREDTPASDISDTTPKVMAGPTLPVELQMEEPVTMETDAEDVSKKKKDKKKKFVRTAAGVIWEDPSLDEWDAGKIPD
jgi:hypothetical protein